MELMLCGRSTKLVTLTCVVEKRGIFASLLEINQFARRSECIRGKSLSTTDHKIWIKLNFSLKAITGPFYQNTKINKISNSFQIVLCTSAARPDFNAEEVASVKKDKRELFVIVQDMADHLPIEDPNKGAGCEHELENVNILSILLSATAGLTCNDQDGRKWTVRRQRRKCFVDCGGCFSK